MQQNFKNLSFIDHIAIIVDNISSSVEYYYQRFNCKVKHQDSSWALLEFLNINLALVTKNEHPNHFAIVDKEINENKDIQFHRDGIGYLYIQDPDSNYIELIDRKS